MNTMSKKIITALLSMALVLVTVAPPRVFAQTLPREDSAAPISDSSPQAPPAKTKPDLNQSLAAEVARAKAGPLTEADLKRIAQNQDDQQTGTHQKKGWSTKKKLLVALAIVVATGAFIVAYKHRCKDTPDKKCPEIEPTDSSDF